MLHSEVPALIAELLAGFFAAAAVLNFVDPAFLKRAYAQWGLRPNINLLAAVFNLVAAVFLAMPITRLWGVTVAALVMFFAEVLLLSRKQYAYALPGLIIMAALVPAALAGPL
ncbi:MAG: hypothetical protein WBQ17_15875 [Rhizomicrobium sp.]|jgi:hypothetical protein